MTKPPSAALGDAYPALRNFLKLTALTLQVPQAALTVQVGSRPYSTGALSYGPITQVMLRQMLEQPQPALAPITEALSLGTLYRTVQTPAPPVALVGRIHPPHTSSYFTLYVPGMVAESLSTTQVKTLAYLSQQLLLCLRLFSLPPDLIPPPLSPSIDDLDIPSQPSQDFLSRVVSINPPRPAGVSRLHPALPNLVDLVTQLQACLSYDRLRHLMAEYLPPFFPHQSGQLVLISGFPAKAEVLTHWGHDQYLQTLAQQCPLTTHPVPAPRLGLCARCHPSPADPLAPATHQPALACTVLGHVKEVVCLLQVTTTSAGPNTLQADLIQRLSNHIPPVMERLLVLEALESKATHDPLTGLLNRRPLETVLQNLCQTANRQQTVSLILIDIDHFKALNDTFGHLAGDRALQDISLLLRGHVRSQDLVCRYGGEEFCMVLFDTPLDVAIVRAEKIRRAVKYLTLVYNDQPIDSLTISLGIACFPRHGDNPTQLLHRADQALYWAKTHGRDRTVSAEDIPSP